jgi:hypothetical protein
MRREILPFVAIALTGWYLMVPARKGESIKTDLPVAKWTYLNSFDTARECRDAATEHQRQAETDTPEDKQRQIQANAWECIATDDPRLAH